MPQSFIPISGMNPSIFFHGLGVDFFLLSLQKSNFSNPEQWWFFMPWQRPGKHMRGVAGWAKMPLNFPGAQSQHTTAAVLTERPERKWRSLVSSVRPHTRVQFFLLDPLFSFIISKGGMAGTMWYPFVLLCLKLGVDVFIKWMSGSEALRLSWWIQSNWFLLPRRKSSL